MIWLLFGGLINTVWALWNFRRTLHVDRMISDAEVFEFRTRRLHYRAQELHEMATENLIVAEEMRILQ